MKDKPRRSGKDGDFIITRPMAYNIFGVGLAFVIVLMGLLLHFHAQDGLTPHDLSWFFSFFVMLQFWNMFNAKAFMEDRSAFANLKAVSYTHLDVYKRQGSSRRQRKIE